MHRLRWLGLLGLSLALLGGTAFAQRFAFQEFNQRDGLADLNIQSIIQDHEGALWVATQNGLFRYDGDRFQAIPLDQDEGVLYVTGLVLDGLGRVWTSTTDDLFYIDESGAHEVRSSDSPFAFDLTNNLAADPDHPNSIYFISHHIVHHAEAVNGIARVTRLTSAQTGTAPLLTQVWSIAPQAGGKLWLGCSKALCSVSPQGVKVFGSAEGVSSVPWTRLFMERSGILWAWSENQVIRWNAARGRFERADHGLPPSSIGIRNPQMAEDGNGGILLNLNIGLARCTGGRWTVYRIGKELPAAEVTALLVDRQNSVWTGFNSHGLSRWIGYDQWENITTASGLGAAIVWNFLRDPKGDLWVGTEADLERIDTGTGKIERQMIPGKSSMRRVQTLAMTSNGHLWAGSDNGTVIDFDPRTRTSRTAAVLRGIFDLTADQTDRVWISSMAGLYVLSPGSKTPVHPPPPAPEGKCYQSIQGSDAETLWFICDSGLYRLAGSSWSHIEMAPDYHVPFDGQLALAADGSLWLTGSPAPLVHIRVEGDKAIELARFHISDVGTENVFTVGLDQRGWVWTGTDIGVAVYNGSEWRRFTTDDGLVWNDTDSNAFWCDRDGSVWIGTSGGISHILHPDRLFDPAPLSLKLDDVRIGDSSLSQRSVVSLPLSRHALTAHMTTLDFKRATQVSFRYRIEGLEEDWQESPRHDLRYTALPSGRFTLVVTAVDPSWHRVSKPVRISFVITPPWWRSPTM